MFESATNDINPTFTAVWKYMTSQQNLEEKFISYRPSAFIKTVDRAIEEKKLAIIHHYPLEAMSNLYTTNTGNLIYQLCGAYPNVAFFISGKRLLSISREKSVPTMGSFIYTKNGPFVDHFRMTQVN